MEGWSRGGGRKGEIRDGGKEKEGEKTSMDKRKEGRRVLKEWKERRKRQYEYEKEKQEMRERERKSTSRINGGKVKKGRKKIK